MWHALFMVHPKHTIAFSLKSSNAFIKIPNELTNLLNVIFKSNISIKYVFWR